MRQADTQNKTPQTGETERPFLSVRRIAGFILLATALLIAWFLLIGFLGWQRGERLREVNELNALTQQIERQKELAAANIAEGQYALATSRLDWILEQDPGDSVALSLKADVDRSLAALFTPTPTPRFTPTPEPTSEPTPTPGAISSPEEELQRIRRLMALKEWETAVLSLHTFQAEFPSYQRQETDRFLYDAYIELALDNLNGNNIELGMFYLNRAATLGDISQEMRDYETWAELYLQGIAFYGANWDAAAYYFRDLCLAAPFFQNSCGRYQDVLVAYGDLQGDGMEWCPAAELYQEATAYDFVPGLNEKLTQANEMCALATPTPETPDLDLSGTPTPSEGDTVGSFIFETPTPSLEP